jgi:hypothetical protein
MSERYSAPVGQKQKREAIVSDLIILILLSKIQAGGGDGGRNPAAPERSAGAKRRRSVPFKIGSDFVKQTHQVGKVKELRKTHALHAECVFSFGMVLKSQESFERVEERIIPRFVSEM